MKVIDLSHEMKTGMPVYPGTESAVFEQASTIEKSGYNELRIHISTHTGTHIDCPKHLIKEGMDTGSFPVSKFIGKAFVIDCTKSPEPAITVELLALYEHQLQHSSFVLFKTDHSRFWGTDGYFRNFPVASQQAAEYLLRFNLKGAGMDAPSFDPVDSAELPNHQILLSNDMVLIENLTNLSMLPTEIFWFSCFPQKIIGGDGSPVRAVAWSENS